MQDALIVLGIIDVLVILAIVLFARADLAHHRKLDDLYGAEDPPCVWCGEHTAYQAPLCPKCAKRLRESQGFRRAERR